MLKGGTCIDMGLHKLPLISRFAQRAKAKTQNRKKQNKAKLERKHTCPFLILG
jgi:hypothetical protein